MSEPKFRKDDIVRMIDNDGDFDEWMGKEFTVHANTSILTADVAVCELTEIFPSAWFELVFRPPTRPEVEVLRRVAKAAVRHHEARVAWTNAVIANNVYGGLCEEVAAASDELVKALTALPGEVEE